MEPVKLITTANSRRMVTVRNDCDGSPDCAAEIHIEEGIGWQECHLTVMEAQLIRKALKKAIQEHENRQA